MFVASVITALIMILLEVLFIYKFSTKDIMLLAIVSIGFIVFTIFIYLLISLYINLSNLLYSDSCVIKSLSLKELFIFSLNKNS